jgi:hypothetical protein
LGTTRVSMPLLKIIASEYRNQAQRELCSARQ